MVKYIVYSLFCGMANFCIVYTQTPFNTQPNWISADVSGRSTGAAWADINMDGWLDLVVANGNDVARQKLVVYYNTGKGTLPTSPNWQSSDIDYNGKLSIGDINNDGYPDVAVSVYLGPNGFNQKGKVKIYLNQNGTLTSNPWWVSKDSMYTFSCAFGDADNDGDLDLAVACGEAYYYKSEYNRIYYNKDGYFDLLPGWKSANKGYSYDVSWVDIDNDSDLDLAFGNERGPNHVYMNYGDSIGSVPIWLSTDISQYANTIFTSDINNDGYIDLVVSDNNQLGGSGRFKIYKNNNGVLETSPFWSSSFSGYGSGIVICDINNDGYGDIITGGWWNPCRIYLNENGTYATEPQWTSATNSVVEEIVCGDYDNDGLDTLTDQFSGNGIKKLYYLNKKPIHSLLKIVIQNDTLARNQYCYDLENGWVSLKTALQDGVILRVEYISSHDMDIAVSNWDANIGNYIFNNTTVGTNIIDYENNLSITVLLQNYPNPFNPKTVFEFILQEQGEVLLKVFDLLGKEVATIFQGMMQVGKHKIEWCPNELANGIYLYQLITEKAIITKKLIILN